MERILPRRYPKQQKSDNVHKNCVRKWKQWDQMKTFRGAEKLQCFCSCCISIGELVLLTICALPLLFSPAVRTFADAVWASKVSPWEFSHCAVCMCMCHVYESRCSLCILLHNNSFFLVRFASSGTINMTKDERKNKCWMRCCETISRVSFSVTVAGLLFREFFSSFNSLLSSVLTQFVRAFASFDTFYSSFLPLCSIVFIWLFNFDEDVHLKRWRRPLCNCNEQNLYDTADKGGMRHHVTSSDSSNGIGNGGNVISDDESRHVSDADNNV